MSAAAGWYPDPGGQPGRFRYWDGQSWPAATSSTPTAAPPSLPPGLRPPGQPAAQLGHGAAQGYPQQYGQQSQPLGPYRGQPAGRPPRRRLGWILGAIGVLAVVVLVVVLIVRALTAPGPTNAPPPDDPTSSSTAASCPGTTTSASSAPASQGGRVVSGHLSYPELGSPWSAPASDSRVPFGRDVRSQTVVLERANGKPSWAADVLIARLLAGDGFFGPQQGSKIVVSCILGTFYGPNAVVTRHDTADKAVTIDGHAGWLVESHLTYDIPDVKAKGELLIVAVVDVGQGEGGLFYASIPDTAPTLVDPARAALADLRVS